MVIPDQLRHSFFFQENEMIWKDEYNNNFQIDFLFLYEAAHYSHIPAFRPWESIEQSIPTLLNKWKIVKEELEEIFKKREKKKAYGLMKIGISLLIELIFWTNELPVQLRSMNDIEKMKIHPVNINERLEFLLKQPAIFPSFIQLKELINEMEKLYAKKMAIKKASKR